MRDSLMELEFKNFKDIPNFDEKLQGFLDSLDDELEHWRGHEEKNGRLRVRYPMVGYACLDGDKIVAISYYIVPEKFSPRWFFDLFFRPKGFEGGAVVKKEYHRRGIASHLNSLKMGVLREMRVNHFWYRVDYDNTPSLKFAEKMGRKPWRKTEKQVYYSVEIEEDVPYG